MHFFKKTPLSNLCTRFLALFADHGISQAQIPRFLPQLTLAGLSSPDRLLATLTPETLDQTAQLFGINETWLEGSEDRTYPYLATYKEPQLLLNHLSEIQHSDGWSNQIGSPLRILATTTKLNYQDGSMQELAPVLVEPIAKLGEETIYRYHVYQDGFDWGHAPARIELKAIAHAAWEATHRPIPIYPVSPRQMAELLEGRLIPHQLLKHSLITNPSLEDYVMTSEASRVAKETDELPEVLAYKIEIGLSFDKPKPQTLVAASPASSKAPEAKPKTDGKRAASAATWLKIEAAATTIWTTDQSATIAAVSRQLQMIPDLGAKAFSEEALRKRIRHLAPEGVRGKSGRKPKQSG